MLCQFQTIREKIS